jgi:hypothetical protein
MPIHEVARPVPGPLAFQETGDAGVLSQAALLLAMGQQLRGDDVALRARAAATTGAEAEAAALPAEDLAEFPLPSLGPTGQRVRAEATRGLLVQRYGLLMRAEASVRAREGATLRSVHSDLAERVYRDPTAEAAAALFEACLEHPEELPRVAAAASYFPVTTEPIRVLDILVRGTYSDDALTREVAATALARIAPGHSRLGELTVGGTPTGSGPVHTSLMVHGTFARNATWWQPMGNFHAYLLAQVRPDLYAAADRFEWSGGYSDAARALGATDLSAWVGAHGAAGLNLFAHSHGGSVSMQATQGGLNVGQLVLLSVPVHVHKYMPDFTRVAQVVSIRVRMDLVILADLGGQRFSHPNIRENVLPLWFDHGAAHDPGVWQAHNVPALL